MTKQLKEIPHSWCCYPLIWIPSSTYVHFENTVLLLIKTIIFTHIESRKGCHLEFRITQKDVCYIFIHDTDLLWDPGKAVRCPNVAFCTRLDTDCFLSRLEVKQKPAPFELSPWQNSTYKATVSDSSYLIAYRRTVWNHRTTGTHFKWKMWTQGKNEIKKHKNLALDLSKSDSSTSCNKNQINLAKGFPFLKEV